MTPQPSKIDTFSPRQRFPDILFSSTVRESLLSTIFRQSITLIIKIQKLLKRSVSLKKFLLYTSFAAKIIYHRSTYVSCEKLYNILHSLLAVTSLKTNPSWHSVSLYYYPKHNNYFPGGCDIFKMICKHPDAGMQIQVACEMKWGVYVLEYVCMYGCVSNVLLWT